MREITDREAIIILSRIRECRFKNDCDMNCSKCPHNYTNEDLTLAVSRAISALIERDKNDDVRKEVRE